jgi:hypothetical protein
MIGFNEGGPPMNLRQQFEALLPQAEALYGPRNVSFIINDIYHVDDPKIPNRLWYPSRGRVDIQLSKAAKGDADRTLVQLSHETVHTLWPISVDDTHVIEEGAATHFSMLVQGYIDPAYPQEFSKGLTGEWAAYLSAANDVKALLASHPKAISAARRGRSFCDISAKDLTDVGCAADVAERLVQEFKLSPAS